MFFVDRLRHMLHALRAPLWVLRRQTLPEDDHGRRGLDMGSGYAYRILHDGKFVRGVRQRLKLILEVSFER